MFKKNRFSLTTMLILLFTLTITVTSTSCKTKKEGCGYNEKLRNANTDKHGNLSTKKGDSNLFGKKMRR